MLEDLTVTAAVGTGRKPPAIGPISPAMDEALGVLADESPAGKLLGAAAILNRYERCGSLPRPSNALPPQAAEETSPPCSRRAGELLAQILSMANNETRAHLIGEWLAAAARVSHRVPHRFLPALLDYGSAHRVARAGIAQVAGTRGPWLMRLNLQWQFGADESENPASVWSTGAREQRVAALNRLRATNPAAARELVQATWKEDAADDRSLFVSALTIGLGAEDEPFLETCLDDRSKQVRTAAAELLARLPRSALVGRMISRAELLLRFQAGKRGGLLRKTTPAAIDVALPPEEFSAQWARDGIIEKPEGKIGRRQWWLTQFLAAIPPTHWSGTWQVSPEECVAAVADEFTGVVLTAWSRAAERHPDDAWSRALLLAAAKEDRGPLTLALLNGLAPAARQAVAAELLESSKMTADLLLQVLRAGDFAYDRHSADVLLRQIDRQREQQTTAYAYLLPQVLQGAALRIPPEFYDELAQRWGGDKWEPYRKALDEFFQKLLLRREIQRELA
ncbi:MAG: hypothetical protein JWP03_1985 [Phycisphaerales bacterium]|nr:hypothetical protein [Phycisphaerales bacterium]